MTGRTLEPLVRFAALLLAWALAAPAAHAQWAPSGPAGQSTAVLTDKAKAIALASGARVLVAGQEDKRFSVLNPDTGTVLGQLMLPYEPKAVAVSADGTKAYVVYNNSTVTALDLTTLTITANWTVGGDLRSVVLLPGETELAVADSGPNRLLGVAAASGVVTRQVALAYEPRDLVAASGGTKLVAGSTNGWLTTVDVATFGIDSQLKVGDEIRSLAWWEAGAHALTVHKRTDAVSLVDITVPEVSATVALDGDPDKGAVAVGAATGYVATHDDASVNKVDLASPGLLGRYAIAARLNALVFDPVANVLYGAQRNDKSLLRLDPAAASLIAVLQLQKRLRDIAINETSHEAVAVADKTDEMFVIKLSDRSVRAIALPARPDLVAVDRELNRAVVAFKGSGPKLRFADLAADTLFAETIDFDKNVNALTVDATRALALAITDGDRPVVFVSTDTRTRLADGPADRYRALAVHAGRGVAYLATEDKKLKVLDLGTRALTATLELGFKVNAIAVDEGLDKAVLTTDSDDKAHVLNLVTLQLEANHVLPKHPGAVSIQADTHVAVIASRESDKVSLLALDTGTLTPGFTTIDKAHAVAVSNRYNQAVVLSGEKDEVAFVQLPNPAPVLETLAPMQAPAGSPALTIALTGTGFTDASRAYFGETELVTRWLSATELEADVTAALLATPADVPVTVRNPAPAGGTSNALTFTVGGAPVLASIQPDNAVADGQDKLLTLTGENFASGAAVLFGTTSLPATFQSSTSLAVTVPGSLTGAAGVFPVSVVNPGGQTSNALPFTLVAPFAVSGFTPATGPVGTAVAISGTGFDPAISNNVVRFNGEVAVIVSGNAGLLNAIVPPRATTGPITVTKGALVATSAAPFTVQDREAFDILLAPTAVQVPPGGYGNSRIRLSSIGLNPYPYAASVAVTGLPAGVTATLDRATVALGQDAVLTLSAAAGTAAGSANVTVTVTGAAGVGTQVRTVQLPVEVLAAGATTVTGRVFHADDGAPFVGARVRLGATAVFSDESGTYRFISPPVLGDQVLLIDGNTNNTAQFEFPSGIAMPVMIINGQDNKALTSFIGRVDATRFTAIVPGQAASVTDAEIPDFSLDIPSGVTIIGWDGQPVTKINVRKVPVDRLPIRPIPEGQTSRSVYLFYFFREGGGTPSTPIPVSIPNDMDAEPGDQVEMWYYDEEPTPGPDTNQWRLMGMGTVSPDGKMVVSNAGVGVPKFCCGAIRIQRGTGSATGGDGGDGDSCECGNPVDVASGNGSVFRPRPFGISKIVPIDLGFQYRSTDPRVGLFGRGTSFAYDWFAVPVGADAVRVTNPSGVQYLLAREADGVFRSRSGRSSAIEMEVTTTPTGRTLRMADGTQYEFRPQGQLTAIVDVSGNRTTFNVTFQGIPQSVTDAAGRTYQFQTVGGIPTVRITRITDPAGRFVEFEYDGNNRLIRYTDQGAGVTQLEYDANHRIIRRTDPRLAVTEYQYDSAGRTVREVLPGGAEHLFAYTTSGNTITETRWTDPNGNVTTYRFNGLGYETEIVDALGRVSRIERDPVNNLVRRRIDPAGRATQYFYNARGDMIRTIDPDSRETLIEYDSRFRKPTRIENALGHVTTMAYDAKGNLTSVTNAEFETTSFTYTAKAQLETITDPLNRVTRSAYDAEGNLIEFTNTADETETRSYDLANRLIAATDSLNRTARFTYDSRDRISEMQDGSGGLTKYAFDANDNLLSVHDQNDNPVERNVYDLRNRLTSKTDAKNLDTVYEYDLVGNLVRMTDRRGRVTEYVYDALNRVTQVSDADGRITTYAYDLAGNLSRIGDTDSGELLMSYDALNRLTEVVAPQGTVSYAYDAIGRRTSRTISGGDVTAYAYDKANRLKTVAVQGKTATYNYDAAGRLTERVLPNGMTVAYSYDAADRVTAMAYQKADLTPVETATYAYDAGGQRIEKALGSGSVQETPFEASYDEANRLTQITLAGEEFTLSYDENGNLASKSGPVSGTTSYTWNARNQLTALAGPAGAASFRYDAQGRRIEKTVNGVTTGFLYDGAQAIAELKGSSLDTVYHTGLAIDEVLARYAPLGNRTLLTDALMSVIAQANDDATVSNFYAYSPYGETVVLGADDGNPLQYTGRENDGTGLYYYRARYYDPGLKRFLSVDPIGPSGGPNLYAYVEGNPVAANDPLGLAKNSGRQPGQPGKCNAFQNGECERKCAAERKLVDKCYVRVTEVIIGVTGEGKRRYGLKEEVICSCCEGGEDSWLSRFLDYLTKPGQKPVDDSFGMEPKKGKGFGGSGGGPFPWPINPIPVP
jgi:RHS repeat-associated protein